MVIIEFLDPKNLKKLIFRSNFQKEVVLLFAETVAQCTLPQWRLMLASAEICHRRKIYIRIRDIRDIRIFRYSESKNLLSSFKVINWNYLVFFIQNKLFLVIINFQHQKGQKIAIFLYFSLICRCSTVKFEFFSPQKVVSCW